MRIFISAGEASGDAYGAALAQEIRRLHPEVGAVLEGLGGRRMRDAGVSLQADTGTWGAVSITQSLKLVPRVLLAFYAIKRRLSSGTPGLFVPIDFGYVNIRLARHAKSRGWRVLYFVPPGSWRRDRQGKDLAQVTDAVATPFPWSADLLRAGGANAHWFGHPIKQLLRSGESSPATPDPHRVAVLPGSRRHEIDENLPLIAEVARRRPDLRFEFGLAPSVDRSAFQRQWERLAPHRPDDTLTQGDTYGVLRRARAAIVCSGTATLEAALCGCPMVVIYRVSRMMEWEAKVIGFKRPKFIALPNILIDRPVVPELVQDEASPEAVVEHLSALLAESESRRRQTAAFEELVTILGNDDAITQTAELAVRMMAGK